LIWLWSSADSRSFADPVGSSSAAAHSTLNVIRHFMSMLENRFSIASAVALAEMFSLSLCALLAAISDAR
jgi:hypothetical protein